MGHIAYVIPDDLHNRAKACAARQGDTLKAWIEDVLAAAVEVQEADDLRRRR